VSNVSYLLSVPPCPRQIKSGGGTCPMVSAPMLGMGIDIPSARHCLVIGNRSAVSQLGRSVGSARCVSTESHFHQNECARLPPVMGEIFIVVALSITSTDRKRRETERSGEETPFALRERALSPNRFMRTLFDGAVQKKNVRHLPPPSRTSLTQKLPSCTPPVKIKVKCVVPHEECRKGARSSLVLKL